MNASCLDEKGRFKSCPYRVYTDEHKAILRGQGRNTVCFTGGEEDYIVVTESLEDIYERIQSAEKRYRK